MYMAIADSTGATPPSVWAVIAIGTAGMCDPASRPPLNPEDPDELSLEARNPDEALASDSSEQLDVTKRLDDARDSDFTEASGPDVTLPGRAPSRLQKADDDTDCGDSGVGMDDGGASAGTR
ncbi:uncharacterized protein IUM83_15172 [Phytophthora cinnamomi]|uniref:uncharacterized protein n=1 Tax=Phytophthora cinnamomi TaxID=4785 RepID=UPI00355938B0|nr:hypothetical protein IUM83_15172 [Phytophthora cinnamomi]